MRRDKLRGVTSTELKPRSFSGLAWMAAQMSVKRLCMAASSYSRVLTAAVFTRTDEVGGCEFDAVIARDGQKAGRLRESNKRGRLNK